MARILLVRHGQSEWNALGRWQGQANPPLTELGVRQAEAAAQAIGTVDVIVASPLERANHTAEVFATQLGIGPVVVIDGLMERSAGEWEGMTRPEIDAAYPGFLAEGLRPPGWEPDEDLLARVLGALDAVAQTIGDDADAVAVTHGGVIMRVEDHLGGGHHRLTNVGARWVEGRDGEWRLGDRIDLLEAAGPLHEAPAASADQI
jgi:broad specificity phosphatase PhoE